MRKFIISLLMASGGLVAASAQGGFGPAAGDVTVSMQLGRAESFSNLQYVQSPMKTGTGNYTLSAPTATNVSASDNSFVNMIGVEGKYFLSSQMAVRLSGMGMIDVTPAQESVPGLLLDQVVSNAEYQQLIAAGISRVIIPSYAQVESRATHRFVANVGADYYLNVGSPRVFPYVGGLASFNYGRNQYYTPDDDPTTPQGVELTPRFFETYGLGGSLVGGVDCYLTDGLFIGLEVKAVSYLYSVNKMMPMSGVEAYDADNHFIGFLTNPMLKIGFKF